jgi:predicted Zn-dependent protease
MAILEPQGILEDVLQRAKKIAGPGAEVHAAVAASRSANTRFARNEIISCGDAENLAVRVTVAYGKRTAGASANQIDPASLVEVVSRAARQAKLAPENPEHMPVLPPQKYIPVPPAFDAATDSLDAAARADGVKTAVAAAEAGNVILAGFLEHSSSAYAMGTSAGLRASHRSTAAATTMTARTPDGTGSGWAGRASRRAAEVTAAALAKVAIDKAVASQKPRPLPPGKYTVVLEPAAVAELLWLLIGSLDARRADEGRSFFARRGGGTKLGEKLFPDFISLRSDPTDRDDPGAPFDGDGLPRRPITWVDRGTLAHLRISRFWAHNQGTQPTAFPDGYHLAGSGEGDVPALVKGVERGVLVTRFWYIRMVDPRTLLATGLTRDGVFLIEKGAVVGPVNNFRFNESPVNMLARADALSAKAVQVPASAIRVPALRTHEFNLASISDAV